MGFRRLPIVAWIAGPMVAFTFFAQSGPMTLFPRISIYLLDRPLTHPEEQSQKLTLGLDAADALYFKLLLQDNVIAGGMLQKGMNRIPLALEITLEPSRSYFYCLELQWREYREKKRIEITVSSDEVAKPSQETTAPGQISGLLSLYIQEQLISQGKKIPLVGLAPGKIRSFSGSNPIPVVSRPNGPPSNNSVSIFNLAAAVAKTMMDKKMARDQAEHEAEKQKKQNLEWTIHKAEPDGSRRPIHIKIRLRVMAFTE